MDDFEEELDKTIAAANKNVRNAEQLIAQAGDAMAARKEWEKANGVPENAPERLMEKLTPEERKKAETEQEQFFLEVKHDVDAAVERARLAQNSGKPAIRRPRNMA